MQEHSPTVMEVWWKDTKLICKHTHTPNTGHTVNACIPTPIHTHPYTHSSPNTILDSFDIDWYSRLKSQVMVLQVPIPSWIWMWFQNLALSGTSFRNGTIRHFQRDTCARRSSLPLPPSPPSSLPLSLVVITGTSQWIVWMFQSSIACPS